MFLTYDELKNNILGKLKVLSYDCNMLFKHKSINKINNNIIINLIDTIIKDLTHDMDILKKLNELSLILDEVKLYNLKAEVSNIILSYGSTMYTIRYNEITENVKKYINEINMNELSNIIRTFNSVRNEDRLEKITDDMESLTNLLVKLISLTNE